MEVTSTATSMMMMTIRPGTKKFRDSSAGLYRTRGSSSTPPTGDI
jgi:hypothetical protein